jgi:hypothetical protein
MLHVSQEKEHPVRSIGNFPVAETDSSLAHVSELRSLPSAYHGSNYQERTDGEAMVEPRGSGSRRHQGHAAAGRCAGTISHGRLLALN